MKKVISLFILLATTIFAFAQTPAQLQQLSKMSKSEIEMLLNSQSPSSFKNSSQNNNDKLNRTKGNLREQTLEADTLMVDTLSKKDTVAVIPAENRIFGRDIFNRENLTFAPSMKIPTPVNYVLAAGDQIIVNVWGASEVEYDLTVTPDGYVSIPSVGLVHVAGMKIENAEKKLRNRLQEVYSGLDEGSVLINISLGDIRSISVNIVGEALRPGTYTLPSLASAFNAMYAAGGTNDIGSLRDIKVYRGGKLVATLDVYDYLINGSSDVDIRLEDNDLIVVSPYQNLVKVVGNVKRPMIYETKKGETLENLIEFVGGFRGDAYTENISVARRAGGKQYSMNTVLKDNFSGFELSDRDSVTVGKVVPTYSNRVVVDGAVWRPGNYELSENISTVKQLIEVAEGLSEDAFGGRAQIIRTRPDKTKEVISVNISQILNGTKPDVYLQKEDSLKVVSVDSLKEEFIITINGEVNNPNVFGYVEGMTIQDMFFMAGGLKESASLSRVEVARRINDPYATKVDATQAVVYTFSVGGDLTVSDIDGEFKLKPYDIVAVRKSPGYLEQRVVTIEGEANFTGEYVMTSSANRLSDLVKFAGGVTPSAYVKGASLQRQYVEQDVLRDGPIRKLMEVSELQNRKRDDRMNDDEEDEEEFDEDAIYEGDYHIVGIDLEAALADTSSMANIVLKAGDKLLIPSYNNVITISGAVYYPTTTTYDKKLRVRDYIKRAGGYNASAKRKPFVIGMNGNVMAVSSWYRPEPGSQIVVPYKPYREPMTPQSWISISSTVVSMAAMIFSLLR